jgi:uncharacterized protein YjbI with pentapeptide repeats
MKKDPNTLNCTYKYSDDSLCNRPITRGFEDNKVEQYCIFHARNDEKLQELKKQMGIEISNATESFKKDIKTQNLSEDNENQTNVIIKLSSKYLLNYEGAYFPDSFDFLKNNVLEVRISFNKAMFRGRAYFNKVMFSGGAYFNEATFGGVANFGVVGFSGGAYFYGATFSGGVNFNKVIFDDVVFFSEAIFGSETNFSEATFSDEAHFERATFSREAEFIDVLFIAGVFFDKCHPDKGKLKFLDTVFFSSGSFKDISEGSNITFINCIFSSVSFLRSRIGNTVFSNCHFNMTAAWINKKIQEINDKLKSNDITEYKSERLNQKSILLTQEKDKINEFKRRKKRLLNKNLLLEHRKFLESPPIKLLMRKLLLGGLKIVSYPLLHLFLYKFNFIREIVNTSIEESNLMDFGEVKDCYMQLKVNMDRMKDYDLANDFYNGEMEMKRLGEKWFKPKRWFLSLYKTLSGYGNAPVRAVIMFLALIWIFSFFLFFMKLGIKDLSSQNKNQASQRIVRLEPGFFRNLGEMASLSLYNMTALSNLTRSPYEPLNKWTFYYVSVVQYFIRPVQIALIILAIRRKVKRGEE